MHILLDSLFLKNRMNDSRNRMKKIPDIFIRSGHIEIAVATIKNLIFLQEYHTTFINSDI